MVREYSVIVIGGGHAGVEAAWAAANLLGGERTVALVTLDPAKIGVMSCNPAIGGLAKGQLVREVDALGGLMGLATDATGIQFRVLNTSKGPAVHGPRAQCDRHAYAETVQAMIAARPEIEVVAGSVERLLVEGGQAKGVEVAAAARGTIMLRAEAVVLTTGTFMRGLMHLGESKSPGGRHGEAAASAISESLRDLGFELFRLKTGTPPRLRRGSIRWDELPVQLGDESPTPFSELSGLGKCVEGFASVDRFPVLWQVSCRQTRTTAPAHELIRANLHRAPMYSGQIESVGPRYCPSIEDKVVRFAERESHGVYLEPESLRDEWVYCNGISTSLPRDVQEGIVRSMPGCERAEVLRHGYAVEYDAVRPHQIDATCMTKRVAGLFLAGQINGTSGYEEAAAQGVLAGINAACAARGEPQLTLGRDEAYIGVLMDDLVTKTPVEPYRMFTSRAEHRLLLRADNAPDRLTPKAERLGMLEGTALGRLRRERQSARASELALLGALLDSAEAGGVPLRRVLAGQEFGLEETRRSLAAFLAARGSTLPEFGEGVWRTAHAERRYAAYIERQRAEVRRQAELEHRRLPEALDIKTVKGLRSEARAALEKFMPRTFGQAGRLEGVTPADLSLLAVHARRQRGRAVGA